MISYHQTIPEHVFAFGEPVDEKLAALHSLFDVLQLDDYDDAIDLEGAITIDMLNMLYGEITMRSLFGILDVARYHLSDREEKVNFLDLGAGLGKVLVGTKAYGQGWIGDVRGIELDEERVNVSRRLVEAWLQTEEGKEATEGEGKGQIIADQGDFSDPAFFPTLATMDIVFICGTAFGEDLMRTLTSVLSVYCKDGTILISVSQPILSCSFLLLQRLEGVQMSWGLSTMFIYKKDPDMEFQRWSALHEQQMNPYDLDTHLHHVLQESIASQIFTAGSFVSLMEREAGQGGYSTVATSLIPQNSLFLIDHIVSFKQHTDLKHALGSVPGLKERLSAVLGEDIEATDDGAAKVERLVRRIEAEDNGLVGFYHYIMDEVGASLQVSQNPTEVNCVVFPFFSLDQNMAYSVLHTLTDIEEHEPLVISNDSSPEVVRLPIPPSLLSTEMIEYGARLEFNAMLAQRRADQKREREGKEEEEEEEG
jgi:SAM-dependent methyltransferase